MEESIEKVADYLRKLNQPDDVVKNFIREKFDETAVIHAQDSVLKKHGITTDGDLIRLRVMCRGNTTDLTSRKQELKEILLHKPSEVADKKKPKIAPKKTHKTIYVSWENYDSQKNKYTVVKSSRGGGCRKLQLAVETGKEELLQTCKTLFWKSDYHPFFKSKECYHFMIADFKHEFIKDFIKDLKGNLVPFTIDQYIESNRMTRTRIYLLTKRKGNSSIIRTMITDSDEETEFDTSTESNVSITPAITSTPIIISPDRLTIENTPNEPITDLPSISDLIGTESERKNLRMEIDNAYEESLQADQRKADAILAADQMKKKLAELMQEREARVEEEPSLSEDHVTVTVRHVILGNRVRLFQARNKMIKVYDWVGSLNEIPEFFKLINYRGTVVQPYEEIESGVYNMTEVSKPLNMSLEGAVAFRGFGVDVNQNNNDTLGEIVQSSDIMKQNIETQNIDLDSYYKKLQDKRKVEVENIEETLQFTVDRDNIYEDFISFYRKADILNKGIKIDFKNGDAVGDGVTRDAFSGFYTQMYKKFEGVLECVPLPNIDPEELTIIGRIMHHGFVNYELFPVQICISSFKKALFDEISDKLLLLSYMNYLPGREAELIDSFSKGLVNDPQPILDILSEHRIFTQPTKDNIFELCLKAANVSLIRLPFFSFKMIIEGMGAFWKNIDVKMFESIYMCTIPSPEKVIKSICPNETQQVDQKVTTWVHRYVRSCTKTELHKFVRFITGAVSLPPSTSLRIEYVDQNINYLHPSTKTCFNILIIPRQYSSFTELRENFTYYINCDSAWTLEDDRVIEDED